MKILIFISIIGLMSLKCMSQTSKECLHGGKLENGTCQCFQGYYGDYCERFNCTNQAKECGISLTPDTCSIQEIKDYCPGMCKKETCSCGFDKCFNNGTFDQKNCKCNCSLGFDGELCENKVKCNQTVCENEGKFNSDKCKCDCYPNFKGDRCEQLDCSINESESCLSYSIDFCSIVDIKYFCPKLCKMCEKTTSTVTIQTTSKCDKICKNGGVLDSNCKCQCYPNYEGELCENIRCDKEEPQSCLKFTVDQCFLSEINDYCPKLCNKCKNNSTATVPSESTATTTELTSTVPSESTATTTELTSTVPSESTATSTELTSTVPSESTATSTELTSTVPSESTATTTELTSTAPISSSLSTNDPSLSSASESSSIFQELTTTGFDCSIIANDPVECDSKLCFDEELKSYCPKTCLCQNICTSTTCQNNGKYDSNSCKCNCPPGFSGDDCSIGPDCSSIGNDPLECDDSACFDSTLKALCPKTCQCRNSTTLTSSTDVISTSTLSNADCDSFPNDPKECDYSFCYDDFLKSMCPKTCQCRTKSTTMLSTTTLTTTNTVITKTDPKECDLSFCYDDLLKTLCPETCKKIV